MTPMERFGVGVLCVGALLGYIVWPVAVVSWLVREVETRSPPTIAPDTITQAKVKR